MKSRYVRILVLLAMWLGAGWSHAVITCGVSSPGFSAYYLPADPIDVTQSTLTVSCTRTSGTDAASVTYQVAVNNGLNPGVGGINRATRGAGAANRINYDTYRDSGCSQLWSTAANRITGTINFPGTGTYTQNQNWWGCIPTGQTGKNAGTFPDTVTMTLTLTAGTVVGAPFTFPVSIVHPANCTISPLPGTIFLAYTSFASTPSSGGTSFGLNCTNNMPYTMALDAYAGTLLGLNYTLQLNNGTLSGTGSGAAVTIPIDGAIAAGQSGTCAGPTCNAVQTHTLTISY